MARLSEDEVRERVADAAQWRLVDGGGALERDWTCEDFKAAIAFVQRVAALAEEHNHHPDILVHGWNKVTLTLSTHSEGGLTDADFQMARRIDALA